MKGCAGAGGEPLCRLATLSASNRRLPKIIHGLSKRDLMSLRVFPRRAGVGWFPGAACCTHIDLPTCEAAPLLAVRNLSPLTFHLSQFERAKVRG